jgi:hypothetical protein
MLDFWGESLLDFCPIDEASGMRKCWHVANSIAAWRAVIASCLPAWSEASNTSLYATLPYLTVANLSDACAKLLRELWLGNGHMQAVLSGVQIRVSWLVLFWGFLAFFEIEYGAL